MKLLTIQELAELLKVKVTQVYQMNYAGQGPRPIRIGHRTVRYNAEDVLAWLAARKEE